MKKTKNNKKLIENIDKDKVYEPVEAIKILKENSYTKFEEALEVAINLGIDASKTEQNIRGVLTLPKGTGKSINVAVVSKSEKHDEAKKAGADTVGENELIESISKGKIDFDLLIATPDMMSSIGKIAKILGPKGLMPNPKTGTVTNDIKGTIENINKGLVAYKNDKAGTIHAALGKVSFDDSKLTENVTSFIDEIKKIKPSGLKGNFVNSVYLSSSMGFGLKVEI